MTLKSAIMWRKGLCRRKKKLVITNGCFDILHRGHAEYLSKACEPGAFLLVALNSDVSVRKLKGKSRPISKEKDRAFLLACFQFVDAVVIFNSENCTKLLKALKPDIYVKGGDYSMDTINKEEKKVLLDAGVTIKFIRPVHGLSSSKVLEKIGN